MLQNNARDIELGLVFKFKFNRKMTFSKIILRNVKGNELNNEFRR